MSDEHLATKEDVANLGSNMHQQIGELRAELHKELHGLTWKLVTVIIALQVPTWIGMGQIWFLLFNIASKLPK